MKPTTSRRVRRLLIPAIVLMVLAVSLTANVVLYRRTAETYRQLSKVELDPYGLKHAHFPADATSGATRDLPVVLFFGDSRAAYWPAPTAEAFRFVNRGIAGQTSEQVRGRFDANVAPLSPRIVLLQAGINDLKAIGVMPHLRDEIVADCKADLREIIRRATESGATVIVTTIFPTGKVPLERKPQWSPRIDEAVLEVNADLRRLASDRVVVLDAWKILEDHGKLRDGYGRDTLHLSQAGYGALNIELNKVLRQTADEPRTAADRP